MMQSLEWFMFSFYLFPNFYLIPFKLMRLCSSKSISYKHRGRYNENLRKILFSCMLNWVIYWIPIINLDFDPIWPCPVIWKVSLTWQPEFSPKKHEWCLSPSILNSLFMKFKFHLVAMRWLIPRLSN